ncbi:hypothetical protein NF212_08245 [Parasalinivibrio latis]|uniref:hypothetical protein n=1 Tax=Parasalinivibrio latis TaxID=2952610 RepID=UPI0030E1B87E
MNQVSHISFQALALSIYKKIIDALSQKWKARKDRKANKHAMDQLLVYPDYLLDDIGVKPEKIANLRVEKSASWMMAAVRRE